ncbi:hypothetical protein [Methylocystis rosea]|uniref:hypothetical protein n=1 Tax=Methylocystis rosea TaxID=173366 RepID=UPI00037CEE9B|nr:hypothetical protein [Methylocystis rosea]
MNAPAIAAKAGRSREIEATGPSANYSTDETKLAPGPSNVAAPSLLQCARATLYATLPTPEGNAYRREIGTDWRTIEAACGCLVVAPVKYAADRTFDFLEPHERGGVMSAVIECFGADRVDTIDLCAWPLNRPEKFATYLRRADGLGVHAPVDGYYFGGGGLHVFRTPEAWLRAHCYGSVILNSANAPRWLAAAKGNIAAEDVEHGREIARALHGFFDPRRILAPLAGSAAA